jgi:virulence-associated protein VapD
MYAIAFDLDTEALRSAFSDTAFTAAYGNIRAVFEDEGFSWKQGSLYYGDENTTPIKCVVLVQRLAAELPWFAGVVRDIRLLRIEAEDDLRPAIPGCRAPKTFSEWWAARKAVEARES